MTSPTHHVPRTIRSVRFGPIRSTSWPQPKLAATATTVRISSTMFAWLWLTPIAWTANTLMTTMTVFTGSV